MTMLLDDLEEFVNKVQTKFWKRYRQHQYRGLTTPIVATASGNTDSSGNLKLNIYVNTTGKHLVVGRLTVWDATHTPANVFTNASGYAYFQTGDSSSLDLAQVMDFLPNSPNGQMIPNVAEYSGHNAYRLKQNETLAMVMVGGPVSLNVGVTMWGFLEPTWSDYDF